MEENKNISQEEIQTEKNEEYVEVDAEDINKVIADAIKKAGKRGAIKGAVITAIVILLIIILGIGSYVAVRVLTGSVPIRTLGFFSKGILDNDTYDKAEGIYALIDNMYFNEIDDEALRDGMLKGMVDALGDPYSVYYTKEEFEEMMESSSGSFEGIGAYLQQDADTMALEVTRPMDGSPAEAAGILAGDIIVTVDGEDVTQEDINVIVSKIRGEKGTTVVLGIKREGEDDILEISVERDVVYEQSVAGEMIDEDNKIGYIYISSFEDDTANQFRSSLEELQSEGMERLIIDLRDDGGGYVDVCTDICDMILPECNIVSTKDKHGITMNYDSSDTEFIRMPIVVLVNENTASASEIMTGALKDNDYATIVGTKTFGKGIVQDVLDLDDGSGVKITVSEYFTPSGECIHGKGIEPDVEIELDVDQYLEDGTDNQLEKAKEVIMQ